MIEQSRKYEYERDRLQLPPTVSTGPMNTMDKNSENKHWDEIGTSLEKYLLMNEQEKDVEIQKAVVRLQKRIHEILYLLETDKPRVHSVDVKEQE